MAVFRVERTGDYTVMSNFHLKDKRLSLKAKGLLSQMLSLPDDWDYTLSGLSYINRESKDATANNTDLSPFSCLCERTWGAGAVPSFQQCKSPMQEVY